MKRICCVFGFAPEYRRGIYELMDKESEMEFDFYFGNTSYGGIKLMNVSKMAHFRGALRNRYARNGKKLVWQGGFLKIFSKKYDAYILTGNPGIRSNWFITLIARLLRRPAFLWSHGIYGYEQGLQLKKNMAYFKFAGNIMTYGEHGRNMLILNGFKPEKVDVIWNSLDYDSMVQFRDKEIDRTIMRYYFGNDDPVMIFVGRLTENKNIEMLVQALAELNNKGVNCNLMLIGDGPLMNKLTDMCRQLNIEDRVWFYGECYDNQFLSIALRNSALCVSPGNVGLTAIHALTFGVPVITHNRAEMQMPEFEAVIPDKTGDLFEYGNLNDLVDKCSVWLQKMSSAESADKCRRECMSVIDNRFNPHNQLKLIKESLRKILG